MSQDKTYELIIVGGGAMGLSSAYNAVSSYGDHPRLEGSDVLVLEQFEFFNQRGSTAGASRQFRVQYSQDYLASLALAALPEWRRLQQSTVEELVPRQGSLWFGDPSQSTQEGGIGAAMTTMTELGVPYEAVDAQKLADWYRFPALPGDYSGFFQATGGIINVPATLRAMFNVAQNAGAQLRANHQVTGIELEGDSEVRVQTCHGEFRAKKLIITPGPFANEVLGHIGLQLKLQVWDMVSAYFRKRRPEVDYPTWFAFQEATSENSNLYYGFPEAPWEHPGYIRVAPDYPFKIVEKPADRVPPTDADFQGTSDWVRAHMPDLDPEPCFKSTCLIALPDDEKQKKELILDFAPGHPNVVVYSGGWAAKFIPLIGKICTQMALTGQSSYDVSEFSIRRKGLRVQA